MINNWIEQVLGGHLQHNTSSTVSSGTIPEDFINGWRHWSRLHTILISNMGSSISNRTVVLSTQQWTHVSYGSIPPIFQTFQNDQCGSIPLDNGSIPFSNFYNTILLYIFSFVATQFSNCGALVEVPKIKGEKTHN